MPRFDDQLVRLYDTVFGRAPDPEGRAFWNNSLEAGYSFTTLAEHFMRAPEFAATYGEPTNRAFVESLYRNILDRPGEADGIEFWTAALDGGRAQRAETVIGFSESSEHVAQMDGLPKRQASADGPGAVLQPPVAPQPTPATEPAPYVPSPVWWDKGEPWLRMKGNDDANLMIGGDGPDEARGAGGNDSIQGGGGNDELYGADGNDTIHGGEGNDSIFGEWGDDNLAGGPGADTFVFRRFGGTDTIADFERGDRIVFEGHVSQPLFTPRADGLAVRFDATSTADAASYGGAVLTGLGQSDIQWAFDAVFYA